MKQRIRTALSDPKIKRRMRLFVIGLGLSMAATFLGELNDRVDALDDDRVRVLEGRPVKSAVLDVDALDALNQRAPEPPVAPVAGAGEAEGT